mgnify:CR=1 FL=1
MIKISNIIEELFENNQWLAFGIQNKLLNLSQVAKFLLPVISTRAKKEVSEASILMAISRLQHKYSKKHTHLPNFKIENLSINTDLTITTYNKSPQTHKDINNFYGYLQKHNEFITVAEGLKEINIIFPSKYKSTLKTKILTKPKNLTNDVSAIIIQYSSTYLEIPGFLMFASQQLYMQNINIFEISSTATELIFFIDKKCSKLAFETLLKFLGR